MLRLLSGPRSSRNILSSYRIICPAPVFQRGFSAGQTPRPSAKSGNRSVAFWLLTGASAAGSCYLIGAKYPPRSIPFFFTPYSTKASQLSQQEIEAYCSDIEHAMHNLSAVREHISRSYEMPSATNVREKYGIKYSAPFADEDKADYAISRPFVDAPPESLEAQLTAGSLRGPNMFATFPMVFSKTKQGVKSGGGTEGDGMVVVHLGKNLCGYKGVIHGGLIATLFDEALARSAFYSLPHHVGVTGKLELRYRKPVAADQFYLIETEVVETVGRKCFVAGFLLDPKNRDVLAEANGVFIEPRWAKYASWVGGVDMRKHLDK